MKLILTQFCFKFAGKAAHRSQFLRFDWKIYRQLASWQCKEHTQKHIAVLKRKEKTMEGDPEPQVDHDGAQNDAARKKPTFQFGTRFLTDPQKVFQHNSWDNVVWDDAQEAEAREKTLAQLQDALPPEKQDEYELEANAFWDKFYNQHQNRFFKDRHWLFIEFPELYSSQGNTNPHTSTSTKDLSPVATTSSSLSSSSTTSVTTQRQCDDENASCESSRCDSAGALHCEKGSGTGAAVDNGLGSGEKDSLQACAGSSSAESFPGESATFRMLEVGCGVGNTVFPVLSTNNDPGLMMYCCDFSTSAVQLVKEHRDYDPKRCHAFVWDITDEEAGLPFPPESLDVIIMIFVLSAVHPDKMQRAVNRLAGCLKPGGQILLRDYGRYDMAQLRFKKGRCLSENFYVRGDGTRVYFFTQEEFRAMFQEAGLEEVQNLIDRRLQVNRGRQLKMYRVWIQCKYRKPLRDVLAAQQPCS